MKVSEVMQKTVLSVTEDAPLKEVGRLIFSMGIAGVPVVKGKKLVGIVTEEDILSKMYPSVQELVEDYVHARNFERMEENLESFLNVPVKNAMNTHVTSIDPDTPIMEAQSILLTHKFSRLPIVNKNNELIGIISQGDIFRQILKKEIPQLEKERYAGFVGKYYDQLVNWKKRFGFEFPSLFKLFKRHEVKSVLDIGVWTGEYTIGLAKKGVRRIVGLDHNKAMIDICDQKKERLSSALKDVVSFFYTDYLDFAKRIPDESLDAAICMGNALPYIPVSADKLFSGVSKVLKKKNAVIIIQLLNFEKILMSKNRLLSFIIHKSDQKEVREHLLIEFFDKTSKGEILHHLIIFDNDGANWIYKGITTIPIRHITKKDIAAVLNKIGFPNISFSGNAGEYQGEYGKLSFIKPFDPLESDWLNIIASR